MRRFFGGDYNCSSDLLPWIGLMFIALAAVRTTLWFALMAALFPVSSQCCVSLGSIGVYEYFDDLISVGLAGVGLATTTLHWLMMVCVDAGQFLLLFCLIGFPASLIVSQLTRVIDWVVLFCNLYSNITVTITATLT